MPTYFSKYLIQSSPPDLAEGSKTRWTFALYEVLDRRHSPIDPSILHVMYLAAIELSPEEMPDVKDDTFSAVLEETVVKKWKATR